MLEQKDIEPFLNKHIAVGVPHNTIPDRLFFSFGYLRSVDATEIKIETNNGFKIIQIDNIIEIHESNGAKP